MDLLHLVLWTELERRSCVASAVDLVADLGSQQLRGLEQRWQNGEVLRAEGRDELQMDLEEGYLTNQMYD